MRIGNFALLVLLLLVGNACKTDTLPESSLTVRESVSNILVATSQTQGTLEVTNGATVQIRVMRTYTNTSGQTQTDDVTQFANFKWDGNPAVASIDQLGNVSGTNAGTAQLEIKFRSDSFEPWDICRLTVHVN